jgi:ParB-like chromosome segregation protein Spo0J
MQEHDSATGNGLSLIRVQLRPVSDLRPFDQNARIHNPTAVSRLVKIIREIGWTNPILIDDDGIIAGHKRRLAALEIYADGGTITVPGGQELPPGMVPVIDVSGWTEAQRRAYIIADNQTTLESEWDMGVLRLELDWLSGSGLDMELTGFDGAALAAALGDGADDSSAPADDILRVSLSDRFGVPPFSVLSARDGWWQDRKRAWLRLGIQSELGRGEGEQNAAPGGSARPLDRKRAAQASPGGSPRPAADYGTSKARGDGRGRGVSNV